MAYISENLMEGEEVIYEGQLSLWALMKWVIPGFVMMPFIFANQTWGTTVFAIGVAMMTAALIQYATTEMAVTTQRVISKRGWISRRTTEISLARVEGVEVNQTMVQRMLNYGNILVSGVGSHKARISSVSEPMEFRKAFLTALQRFEKAGKSAAPEGGSGVELVQEPSGQDEVLERLRRTVILVDGKWQIDDVPACLDVILAGRSEHPWLDDVLRVNPSSEAIRALSASQGAGQ